MTQPILVTGVPGNVSTDIVRNLVSCGCKVRVACRNIDAAKGVLSELENVEYVPFGFANPSTHAKALEGVSHLYLMRPPAISDVKGVMVPFIDAAKLSGLGVLSSLSLMGAEKNPIVRHSKIEKYVLSSGLTYTFLRPTWFMQNLSTTYRNDIRDKDEIVLCAGKGKMSLIDARDISAVAAKALVDSTHENKAYKLTGCEAYDFYDVATIFSEVLDRPILYTEPSVMAYRRHMAAQGHPRTLINITMIMYLLARMGVSAGLTSDTERILGRKPITLREFVQDFAGCWR